MVGPEYLPERGDIVWLDFTPQSGHEQAGRRPALVLSPCSYNKVTDLALFCPITSQIKGYPFEVHLPSSSPVSGVVLADHIKSLDWRARNASFKCRADRHIVDDVLEKVNRLLA